MINLAGKLNCDSTIREELRQAGVALVYHEERSKREVPATLTGEIPGTDFVFHRGWYYWVVEGKVPLETANKMYENQERRKDVRVAGHCGCPPPEDWAEPNEGLIRAMVASENRNPEDSEGLFELLKRCRYVTLYHIDSQEGLNFFVESVSKKA